MKKSRPIQGRKEFDNKVFGFIRRIFLNLKLASFNEEYKVIAQCEKDENERDKRLRAVDLKCKNIEKKLKELEK